MTTSPAPNNEPNAQPPAAAAVADHAPKPKGVIPKNLQSLIWLAVLILVAVGIFFSGGHKKGQNANTQNQATDAPVTAAGLSPEQVQKRFQESEEEARRHGLTPGQTAPQPQPGDPQFNPDAAFLTANQPSPTPAKDPLEEDERKREYLGRYASNVALSYRPDVHTAGAGERTPPGVLNNAGSADDLAAGAQSPTLPLNFQQQLDALQAQQQQLLAASQQQFAAANAAAAPAAIAPQHNGTLAAGQARKTTNANNSSTGKTHIIFEGTLLESVLVNRLSGDFAGPVVCLITTDLYSHDHSTLLVPAGTRVLGETKKVDALGQTRLAVAFHRLIMPDGYAVDLDQAPALNQVGETAFHDKVNNHYFQIFGASIAVGAIAGLSTIGTNNSPVTGLPTSTADAYREGVAASLSQSSLQILNKFLNILPTITIREGHRVRIFLTQDLQVPAYANHTIPSDL